MKTKILSILGGIVAAGAASAGVNQISRIYYPLPPGLSVTNTLALELYLAYMPTGAYLFAFAGMALAGIAGGFTAAMIDPANGRRNGILVAVLFTFFGIAGMLMVTHPLKLWIINIFTYVPCAIAGNRIARSMKGMPQ